MELILGGSFSNIDIWINRHLYLIKEYFLSIYSWNVDRKEPRVSLERLRDSSDW